MAPYRAHGGGTDPDYLAIWRRALMKVMPAGHPVQDTSRTFTEAELERFEAELFARIEEHI